jgi:hypothetical protein
MASCAARSLLVQRGPLFNEDIETMFKKGEAVESDNREAQAIGAKAKSPDTRHNSRRS